MPRTDECININVDVVTVSQVLCTVTIGTPHGLNNQVDLRFLGKFLPAVLVQHIQYLRKHDTPGGWQARHDNPHTLPAQDKRTAFDNPVLLKVPV